MTIFHIIGYWYLAITLIGIAALLSHALIEFIGRTVWRKVTRLHDIYVVNWWIEAIKKSGLRIPTKSNVDKLRRDLASLDEVFEEGK